MGPFVLKRLGRLILQLFFVVSVLFVLFRLVPGDPARLLAGMLAGEEEVARVRRDLGLDRPLLVQYVDYVQAAVRGDFGRSLSFHLPVVQVVANRLAPTLLLMACGIGLSVLLGVPAGIAAAVRARSWLGGVITAACVALLAIPNFWLGLLMIDLFSVRLGWLPAVAYGTATALVMPSLAIAARLIALIARTTRASILEVLGEDYIRTAHAKGLPGWRVVSKHALKPALGPIVTMVGLQAGYLLGGSVVIEQLFSYPGIGQLLIAAVGLRDYPLVQGSAFFFVGSFLLLNLLVDVSYSLLDPRIRYE